VSTSLQENVGQSALQYMSNFLLFRDDAEESYSSSRKALLRSQPQWPADAPAGRRFFCRSSAGRCRSMLPDLLPGATDARRVAACIEDRVADEHHAGVGER
jgi:hypothetical protein